METIIAILSIYSVAVLIKEKDGPFDILTKIRNLLLQNKVLGVFFYKLLSCYFCVGTYAGVIVYLLHNHLRNINVCDLILWGLAGSMISMIANMWVSKNGEE